MIIDKTEQFTKLLGEKKHILVDFFATWCGPCKMLKPVLQQLETEESDFVIAEVDVDNFEVLTTDYVITSMPTLVWIKDGKEVHRHSGYLSLEALKDLNEKFF